MSNSQRVYVTMSIDAASNLAALGFPVSVHHGGDRYAIFEFQDSPELRDAILDYSKGGFTKRLLNARSRLYREASEVMKRGVRHD